jgi:ankyrin repeat protein
MTRLLFCLISFACLSAACAQSVDTDLYNSIVNDETDTLTLFLNSGGNPSATIRVPQTDGSIALLDLAVRAGNQRATALLLRAGATPEDIVEFLEMLAEKGFAEVINALLDQDPALVARMRSENHPLVLAVAAGHDDVVSAFLKKMSYMGGGAEVRDVLNQGLLGAISKHGPNEPSHPLIMTLLDAGADPISTTALAGAVLSCNPNLVATFLVAGADAKRAYDVGIGPTYLAEFAVRCFENTPDNAERILREIASAGADPCAVDLANPRVPESARTYLRETEACR